MKHISDQEIKESILENNPVPSDFLSRQKIDDYLLEILSEAGKKDKIFSDRSLMKVQEHLTNIKGPLGTLWAHLDHLKKDNECVIDINMLLELVDQCVINATAGDCIYKRQRVLTALFKDRRKVTSLLKEGTHCFEKKQKVLFGERFNETMKSKNKTKRVLEGIYQTTPAKCPCHYGLHQPPFRQGLHSNSLGRGHQSYQNHIKSPYSIQIQENTDQK